MSANSPSSVGYFLCVVAQSCLTFCDPLDCSPSGSSVHGILQARRLEWVAIFFSRGSSLSGIEPRSPALLADSLPLGPPGKCIRSNMGSGVFSIIKIIAKHAMHISLWKTVNSKMLVSRWKTLLSPASDAASPCSASLHCKHRAEQVQLLLPEL